MPRHSLPPPAASAPTSPAVARSKQGNPPATPQRTVPRAHHRQVSTSPYTPTTLLSTPYTPHSLHSFSSSNVSSLATPASIAGQRRQNVPVSPENSFRLKDKKSYADITGNWRNRAGENDIKVRPSEESQFADDEGDDGMDFDGSSFFSIDQALLPAPFLSSQRRARAFTTVQPPVAASPLIQIPNPQLSTPARASLVQTYALSPAYLNTPPPNPALFNKIRLRGTVTDPAQTRRRPAFGQMSELCDIEEDEFLTQPPAYFSQAPSQMHSRTLPLHLQDPFDTSVSSDALYYDAHSLPAHLEAPKQPPAPSPPSCSVCGACKGSLAVLEPCAHPLCSGCLTSALNIVGEKDMECAVCKSKVLDFKLKKVEDLSSPNVGPIPLVDNDAIGYNHGFMLPNDGAASDFFDRAQGASTPVAHSRPSRETAKAGKLDDSVVLRIDNVPWDITPPAIATWLKHPVKRVHVLLDRKGKTLSHAFVEMVSPEAAKAALRTSQNSVLGKGKRARGVTVTRSNQEELMRALFPSWQGTFDGARPTLSGLSNEHVIAALQHGLISESDLKSLLHLIRSPDSHFLKVPSLPFHSLISILSKFPTDEDSRVFWSGNLRDLLYEVTQAAVEALLSRTEDNPFSEWANLAAELARAAIGCQAFTTEQMSKLSDMLEAALPPATSSPAMSYAASPQRPCSASTSVPPLQSSRKYNIFDENIQPYGDLAKEFGVDAHLVEALAQRLSKFA
ncbi:RING-finger domain-containing protein [Phanerochaete sordida]|uniref:RING-finger domain-containing protein n=1 Tax=Phanerochaete sordida TaxID=48140 RepID=A0A9P3LAD0_9APHY|nr:RING-finger domain-containing protein [Phanerochaete sordida]